MRSPVINRWTILAVAAVNVVCAAFFLGDIAVRALGLPIPAFRWQLVAIVELAGAIGLVLGAVALTQIQARAQRAEARLRLASAAVLDLMERRFAEWGLTPAERDVAVFAIKGLGTGEIAALRRSREGTVKAQTNAIYRKAGVKNRAQLLSVFLDDLIAPSDAVERAPERS